MAQVFSARLKLSVQDVSTGEELLAHRNTYQRLLNVTGPTKVYLKPGETWKAIDIPGPLEDGSPYSSSIKARSVLMLTTDTPGVRYLCSNAPAPSGALAPGRILLTGLETIREQDFEASPTPVWADSGNWLNHNTGVATNPTNHIYPPTLRHMTEEDARVHLGNETGYFNALVTGGGGLARGCSRFIYGRQNKVNLGTTNDGLEFDFWARVGQAFAVSTPFVKFGSYPYVATTNESDLADTDGDEDDTTYLLQPCKPPSGTYPNGDPENDKGAYWFCDLRDYATYTHGVWNHWRLRKQDFTAHQSGGVDPDWSRITWIEFFAADSSGTGFEVGPLYLTCAAGGFRHLDSVAIETLNWASVSNEPYGRYPERRDRERASLCLFGPPDHGANVEVFWGIA